MDDVSEALIPYQIGVRDNADEFHVRDYWLTDHDENISINDALDLFRSGRPLDFVIYGKMLPSSSYPDHDPLMFKSGDITKYYLDLGSSCDDPGRGLWMMDTVSNRIFKLIDPAHEQDKAYVADILGSRAAYNHAAGNTAEIHVTGHVNNIILTDPRDGRVVPVTYLAPVCGTSRDASSSSSSSSGSSGSCGSSGSSSGAPRLFELQGELIPRSKSHRAATLLIRLSVTHYRYHIPLNKKSPHYWAVQDTAGLWYRVLSFESSVSAANHLSLSSYNWPNDENMVYRHVAQYCLKAEGVMVPIESLHVCLTHNVLTGLLMPPPTGPAGSHNANAAPPPVALSVSVEVDSFSVDFGDGPNRGLWTASILENKWYKLETGRIDPQYLEIGQASELRVANFLAFHDAVTQVGKQLSSGHYVVKESIDEVWHQCGGTFSLDFVRKNKKFCEYQISAALDTDRCRHFLRSIKDMKEQGEYVPAPRTSKPSSTSSSGGDSTSNKVKPKPALAKPDEPERKKTKKSEVELSDIEDSSSSSSSGSDSEDESTASSSGRGKQPLNITSKKSLKRPAAGEAGERGEAEFEDSRDLAVRKKMKTGKNSSSSSGGSGNGGSASRSSTAATAAAKMKAIELDGDDDEAGDDRSSRTSNASTTAAAAAASTGTSSHHTGGIISSSSSGNTTSTSAKRDHPSLQQPAVPISAGGTGRTVKTVFLDQYPSLQRKKPTSGTTTTTTPSVISAPIGKRPLVSVASPPVSISSTSTSGISRGAATVSRNKDTTVASSAASVKPVGPAVVHYRSDGSVIEATSKPTDGRYDLSNNILSSSAGAGSSSSEHYKPDFRSVSAYANMAAMGTTSSSSSMRPSLHHTYGDARTVKPLSHNEVMDVIFNRYGSAGPVANSSNSSSSNGGGGGYSSSSSNGGGGAGYDSRRHYSDQYTGNSRYQDSRRDGRSDYNTGNYYGNGSSSNNSDGRYYPPGPASDPRRNAPPPSDGLRGGTFGQAVERYNEHLEAHPLPPSTVARNNKNYTKSMNHQNNQRGITNANAAGKKGPNTNPGTTAGGGQSGASGARPYVASAPTPNFIAAANLPARTSQMAPPPPRQSTSATAAAGGGAVGVQGLSGGRGRHLTQPAWMTSQSSSGFGSAAAALVSNHAASTGAASGASGQFENAPPHTSHASSMRGFGEPTELGLYSTDPLEVREAEIKRRNICINCDSPGHNHHTCRQKPVKCPECFLHGHLLKYCWFREDDHSSDSASGSNSGRPLTESHPSSDSLDEASESLEEVYDKSVMSDVDKRNIIRKRSDDSSVMSSPTDAPHSQDSCTPGSAVMSPSSGAGAGGVTKFVTFSWNPASSEGGHHTPEEVKDFRPRGILKKPKQAVRKTSSRGEVTTGASATATAAGSESGKVDGAMVMDLTEEQGDSDEQKHQEQGELTLPPWDPLLADVVDVSAAAASASAGTAGAAVVSEDEVKALFDFCKRDTTPTSSPRKTAVVPPVEHEVEGVAAAANDAAMQSTTLGAVTETVSGVIGASVSEMPDDGVATIEAAPVDPVIESDGTTAIVEDSEGASVQITIDKSPQREQSDANRPSNGVTIEPVSSQVSLEEGEIRE